MKNDFRQIISKASSSFGIQIVGMGLGYLFGILVSQIYGAETFGVLSLGMSALNLLSIISIIGLDRASVKTFAQLKAKNQNEVYSSYIIKVLTMGFCSSVFLAALFWFGSQYIAEYWYRKPEIADALRIFAPGVVGVTLLAISSESFRGLQKIKSYTFFKLASIQVASTMLLLALTYVLPVPNAYAWSYIGGTILSAIWCIWSFKNFIKSESNDTVEASQEQSNYLDTTSILKLSIPLALASSFAVVMSQVSLQMTGRYLSELDAGFYAAAVKISMLSAIALKAVNSITSPKFAAAKANDDMVKLKNTARFATTLSLVVTLPIVLVCWLVPEVILSMYGNEFAGAAQVLQVLAFGRFMAAAAGPTVNIMQMTGLEKEFQYIILVALITLVLLNLWWIPKFGIIGVAFSSTIATILNNILCLIVIKVKLGFWNVPMLNPRGVL